MSERDLTAWVERVAGYIIIPKRLGLVYSMVCLRSTELMGCGSSSIRMITGQHTSTSSGLGWRPSGIYSAQMA
jgi:hypothetical protein